MLDVLGPGLIGGSFLVEFAVLMYVLITLRPGFPYVRVVSYAAGFYLILLAADFLGPHWVHTLVDNVWSFIGNEIASVF
jgi:hypothetical protein